MAYFNNTVNATNEITYFWQNTASYYIGVHGMFILAPIGIVGNILAFLAYGRMKPRCGFTLYLQGLALADFISLIWDSVIATALPQLGIQTESSSYWACKLGIWHNMASSVVSSGSLLLVAIDRVICLYIPNVHKVYFSGLKYPLIISLCLWVFTYAYCTPLIYFYEYSNNGGCTLSSDPTIENAGLQFVKFLAFGPYFSISLVGILISNVSILRLFYVRKQRRLKLGIADSKNETDEASWLMIIDSIAFAVLIGLVAVLWAIAWMPAENKSQQATFGLCFVLAEFVSCVEESVDFFIYFMFSKKFRKVVYEMILKSSDNSVADTNVVFTSSSHRTSLPSTNNISTTFGM